MINDKRGFLEMETFYSPAFFILTGIGYAAYFMMTTILNQMETEIMPMWVKIITIIAIPFVAMLFTEYASG